MTEKITSEKQTGGPHAMLRGLIALLVVALVALVGFLVYSKMSGQQIAGGPKQVGMLDREAIYALPEFVDAKKQIEAKDAELRKKLQAEIARHPKPDPATVAQMESLRQQMGQQLQMEQNKILKPLYDRVTASIATLAKEKNLRVVLDKKIVVTGVTDITEDVKKLFTEKKDIVTPEGTAEGESHVGFVNQDVVAGLKMFKQANDEFNKFSEELRLQYVKQYGKQVASLSEAERQKLQAEMTATLQQKNSEMVRDLQAKVNDAITQVAKDKGLSLVLDSQHVLWGGRNLTDDVMKKLVDQPKS